VILYHLKVLFILSIPHSTGANSVVGAAVFNSIQNFKPYQDAQRIAVYLSMPTGEIQTDSIVRHALSAGKQVFVPYIYKLQEPSPGMPKSIMDMVDLHNLSDYESLKPDTWGIPTIKADTISGREHILVKGGKGLDLILMPGVAFDIDPETSFIRRLGHGRGFYDYFLHHYRQNLGSQVKEPSKSPGTGVLLHGLALEEQFLGRETEQPVLIGEHDSLLHGILVGDGKIVEGPLLQE
jgi:5-formyltetrahydrofolate cyclo-ligase